MKANNHAKQTALTNTAMDIQADDHEAPKAGFADPKLGQLLRLQEADYRQAIDEIAKDQAQYRAQIALAQSSCAPVLCHLGCCLKSAWRWLSRLGGLSDRVPQ